MTTNQASRAALRAQLLEAIDGRRPDPEEGAVGSFVGLLESCELFGRELAHATRAPTPAHPTEAQQTLRDAITRGALLIAEFRRFAVRVREFLTGSPVAPADLLSEIVNDSDQCSGCMRLYETPEQRDARTGAWAWRRCPSFECKYHGRTVAYSRDWERRARDLLSAAFDCQAERWRPPVDAKPSEEVARLMRTFKPGARVEAALDIVYADRAAEIRQGARGTIVAWNQRRLGVTGLSAVVWDGTAGTFATSNDSIDPVTP